MPCSFLLEKFIWLSVPPRMRVKLLESKKTKWISSTTVGSSAVSPIQTTLDSYLCSKEQEWTKIPISLSTVCRTLCSTRNPRRSVWRREKKSRTSYSTLKESPTTMGTTGSRLATMEMWHSVWREFFAIKVSAPMIPHRSSSLCLLTTLPHFRMSVFSSTTTLASLSMSPMALLSLGLGLCNMSQITGSTKDGDLWRRATRTWFKIVFPSSVWILQERRQKEDLQWFNGRRPETTTNFGESSRLETRSTR